MSRTPTILAALLLTACNSVSQDELLVSDEDAFGELGGVVLDLDGEPISGVVVTAQGMSAVTGSDGTYLIDGILPASDFTVEFAKRGFAKGYSRTSLVSWETTTANKVLLAIDGIDTFDSRDGGTIEVIVDNGRPLTATFGPDAIVDASGARYDGVVEVEVTYVNPRDETLLGAPGDLAALAFPKDSGAKEASEPTQLVSYGMADITLYPEGCAENDEGVSVDADGAECEPLNLLEGETAAILMPVNDDAVGNAYRLTDGTEQPSWSYDGTKGLWVEETGGVVVKDENGEFNFDFEASHFSWWNCDQGFTPTCAEGRVVDHLGFPVRSAQVVATGSQTNSLATTDEDGFFTIAVMAGDTISVEGATYVADRNWTDAVSAYIDCPDGDHFCEVDASGMDGSCYPLPEIQIPVCRESGVIMTDNITSHLSATEATNGDRLRAFFWEAPGDVEYCQNPWDNIGLETCQVLNTGDYATHDISSVDGLPLDLRPVGDWLEISNGREEYTLTKEVSDGKPFYTFETEEFNGSSSDYLETNDIDLRGGDVLSALAPGDSSVGMGSINESNWVTIPAEFTSNGMSGPTTMSSSSGTTINFSAANNGDGILVFGASVEQSTEVDDSSDFMVCRFNDDGSITIPGDVMGAIDNGVSGLSVFRPEIGWTPGPDGLPIRIQAFSGTSVEVDMQ